MNRPAVFLDRDGVLNASVVDENGVPHPPADLASLEFLPGVAEACEALRMLGYALVVVTNQPDIARGTQKAATVESMNGFVLTTLRLDAVRMCPHDDDDGCSCRKPLPGLITGAASELGLDLSRSFLIGDRWKDVAAGKAAGCRTILVGSGSGEQARSEPEHRARSLVDAAAWIAAQTGAGEEVAEIGTLETLRVQIFADGADEASIARLARNDLVRGFTTNPTLMRRAGVSDYRAFAERVLPIVGDRPISFEVFADDFAEMEEQAREIASWGSNVFVKIPISNTRAESSRDLVRRLSAAGVQLNVTAVLTLGQVREAADAMANGPRGYISLFAGRVADTGRDPVPMVAAAIQLLRAFPHLELIWASPRELLNIFQADAAGCHVITVGHDLLEKLPIVGKDLEEYSLETVRMFQRDAAQAGYRIEPTVARARPERRR